MRNSLFDEKLNTTFKVIFIFNIWSYINGFMLYEYDNNKGSNR